MVHKQREYGLHQLEQFIDDEGRKLIEKKHHFCMKTTQGGYLLNLYYYDVTKMKKEVQQVYLYIYDDEFVMMSDSLTCQNIMDSTYQDDDGMTQLMNFFSALITEDIDTINALEQKITLLEDKLLEDKKIMKQLIEQIVLLRRRLVSMKQYYEQLEITLDLFIETIDTRHHEMVEHKYQIISRRLEQYLSVIQGLQEELIHVREIYQSKVDMEQNHLIKLLTVITTIFTPLTVLTGWYGMNFKWMPELGWAFGYEYVIFVSIGLTCCSLYFFVKKGWFK